jgi:hypothetical protein
MADQKIDIEALTSRAGRMLDGGASLDDVLRMLRQHGATVTESISVIRDLRSMSLSEAKDLIHDSRAWSDVGRELAASQQAMWDELVPMDVSQNHVHLEQLNPETGEVIQNLHLRW